MSNLREKFASWEAVTLGAVCVFKGGSGFKESFQGTESGEHPFIKVSDLNLPGNEKYVLHSNNWVSAAELKLLKATLQPIGATVFAKVGAALKLNRRRVLVRPTVIDNNMMAAIPDETHLNREYLYYFLLGEDLGRFSQESAVPSINQGHLESIQIPLPPLAEQRKIAEILRTWDEAIETAEAELKAKQGRKRGLTKKLLMPSAEGDGALRMNCWDVYKIGELCDVITGSTPSRTNSEYWNGGSIPWFTVDDIRKGGRAIHNTIQHVTEKAVKESSLRLMPADTVLLCCTASVGEYAITRLPITSNQQFNGLVIKSEFKDKLSADFLFNVASTLKEKLKAFCGKTSVDFVSGSNLKSIQIPLPPLAEQRKIAEILQGADSDIETINHRIESLRTQKRGLMQKLLTGEVRVAA